MQGVGVQLYGFDLVVFMDGFFVQVGVLNVFGDVGGFVIYVVVGMGFIMVNYGVDDEVFFFSQVVFMVYVGIFFV